MELASVLGYHLAFALPPMLLKDITYHAFSLVATALALALVSINEVSILEIVVIVEAFLLVVISVVVVCVQIENHATFR